MKSLKFIAAAMALVAAVACNQNKPASENGAGKDSTAVATEAPAKKVSPEQLKPSKSLVDSVSYLLGVNFGSMIKMNNFGDLNFSEIKKGINDFVNSKGNMRDTNFVKQFKINPNEINRIMDVFMQQRHEYVSAVNKISHDKYFADLDNKSDIMKSASGLYYTIQDPGSADKPKLKDTVYVHYKLTKTDGEVMEEVKPENPSIRFTLGRGIIPAWSEGLQLIGVNGKETLYVPASLGYGEQGSREIQPYTPLVFEITLDSLRHYVEPAKDETDATKKK